MKQAKANVKAPGSGSLRGMAVAEAVALPVMVPLDMANRALGIGRTSGYAMAKQGDYPVRVHRLGAQYRVARADLLRLLGIEAGVARQPGDAG